MEPENLNNHKIQQTDSNKYVSFAPKNFNFNKKMDIPKLNKLNFNKPVIRDSLNSCQT